MMSSEKKSYRAEWICATVALCYSVSVIVSILYGWGQSFDVDKMGSLAISAALKFGVPLLCSIAAITGSKGRPNGRIGFLPLMVTVGASAACLASWITTTAVVGRCYLVQER